MTESQAIQKVQTAAEGKIRVEMDFRGLKRLNYSKENIALCYEYIFGEAENPFKDLIHERDDKLSKIESDIDEVLRTVRL